MEIVDTVYLVALLNPDDPRHDEAVEVLGGPWLVLAEVVPSELVEALTPRDFAVAVELHEVGGLDYFDALVAAQCVVRGARPLTTDSAILRAVEGARRGR